MNRSRRHHPVRATDGGFTLVELLAALMIASILSAVALPMYMGYTKDARLAEGKGIAGSALTALQGCVQPRPAGSTCDLTDITSRIGVDSAGTTGNGRWTVTTASLTFNSTSPVTMTGTVGVVGVAGKETNGVGIGLYVGPTGAFLRCEQSGNVVPASNGGNPC
jgi:type IV pilus assembly protein PilA